VRFSGGEHGPEIPWKRIQAAGMNEMRCLRLTDSQKAFHGDKLPLYQQITR